MLKALPYRPGVVKDDSELASQGYAIDSEQIRWVRGRAQVMGGWQTLSSSVRGTARAMVEFLSRNDQPLAAIGTHKALMLWDGKTLFDITPLRSSGTAGTDPIETENGSSIVTVSVTAHGADIGAIVYLRGATAVGGVTVGGGTGTMASNPFITANGSTRILVQHTAHGLATNDIVHFTSATTTGGVLDTVLNASAGFRVRVTSANRYEIEVDDPATSDAAGGGTPTYAYAKPYEILSVAADSFTIDAGTAANADATGGGSAVGYQFDINPGEVSTRPSGGGYSSGLYGQGFYGQSASGAIASTLLPARVWSLAVWGTQLVANVSGAGIYLWEGNRSKRAALLANAPARCNAVMVTPERFLLAMGCTNGGGDFDPLLVRFPSGTDLTVWAPSATNNAGSIRIGKGSEIVTGIVGQNGPLLWTDTALYRVRFVGEFDQIYVEDLLGLECGLLAPNAAIQTGGGATYWLSSNYQFFVFAGGQPREVPCPIREWLEGRIEKGQALKVFASNDSRYPAVMWDYQSTSSELDTDSYVRLDLPEQQGDPNAGWSFGTRARSAWSQGSIFPAAAPLGVSPQGTLYEHEGVPGADGTAVAAHVRWAPAEIEFGDLLTTLTRVVVDGEYQDHPDVTLYGRLHPRQDEFTKGPMTVNRKGYVDRVIKARQIGIKIAFDSARFWRLGVLKGDISDASRR